MSRRVDVKALVSHIVRGDGSDKCRICMGDTSEGQVYLGDTVMMDGDRAVTLSELLESITGVEVPLQGDLPTGLCPACYVSAQAAAAFRSLCQLAVAQWHTTIQLLDSLPEIEADGLKSIHAILQDDRMIILDTVKDEIKDESEIEHSDVEKSHKEIIIRPKVTRSRGIRKLCHCSECGKTFTRPIELFKHLMESTDYKRACYICAAIMPRDDLVNHLRKVHKRNSFDCKKCPALLTSRQQFDWHMLKAHSSGSYSCGDCGRSFQTLHAFNGHTTMHAAKTCPGCDKLFRNRKCYMTHVKQCCNLDRNRKDAHRTKHRVLIEVKNMNDNKKAKVGVRGSVDKECICDYCGKKFAGKKFVSTHIQTVHMKNTHRPCHYCGKSYAAVHMTEHLKKHEEVLSFTCEHCGVVLKTRLGYIQHIRLHTGERPYKCKYCTETFSASSRRSEHVRKAHKTPDQIVLKHTCELCPARFRLPFQLKQHISTVHSDARSGKTDYECSYCHVKFSTCRGLLYHSRQHQTFNFKSLKDDLGDTVTDRRKVK